MPSDTPSKFLKYDIKHDPDDNAWVVYGIEPSRDRHDDEPFGHHVKLISFARYEDADAMYCRFTGELHSRSLHQL